MKKIISLLLICLPIHVLAQSKKSIKNVRELTDSIQRIVHQEHITGLMLAITSKDSILFSGGFGYADLNTRRPVNGTTLFRLGSITKSFVAIAIMQLVEEGKLHLDDELKKIAPEVRFKNPWESSHPVRIINLLEHT